MNKQTRIVIAAVIALGVMVGLFAFLNRGSVAEKKRIETDAVFKITQGGKTLCEVSMADIEAVGTKDIKATMDTSKTEPTQVAFTAAEVKAILAYKKISLDGVTTLEFRALDGYASAVTIEEMQAEQNVYICIKMNGKALGTKSEGGTGPYLMVIKSATYSQRWCKFLEEIVLK